jgi:hypothetical protein
MPWVCLSEDLPHPFQYRQAMAVDALLALSIDIVASLSVWKHLSTWFLVLSVPLE